MTSSFEGNESTPVGSVIQYAGNVVSKEGSPSEVNVEAFGWIVCDGKPLVVGEYPELFSVIGYMFGTVPNSTDFKLPNYKSEIESLTYIIKYTYGA